VSFRILVYPLTFVCAGQNASSHPPRSLRFRPNPGAMSDRWSTNPASAKITLCQFPLQSALNEYEGWTDEQLVTQVTQFAGAAGAGAAAELIRRLMIQLDRTFKKASRPSAETAQPDPVR
jgi:hypothetical protein